MKIQLVDRNAEMCAQWRKHFKGCEDVVVHHGDFFSLETDCIVSPANSFGFMDGGLDLAIMKQFGTDLESRVQKYILFGHGGELLVGEAFWIETGISDIPYMICAPTMRVPMILKDSVNVYLASKAIFKLLRLRHPVYRTVNTVTISGLGTGIGKVPYDICAKQMRQAYEDAYLGNYTPPATWKEAQDRHQLMYSGKTRNLMLKKDIPFPTQKFKKRG